MSLSHIIIVLHLVADFSKRDSKLRYVLLHSGNTNHNRVTPSLLSSKFNLLCVYIHTHTEDYIHMYVCMYII